MAGAEWVSWVAAAMFATLALFYVVRLVARASVVDASRAVMSLGMVAMLLPWLDPLPRVGWEVLFGVAGAHLFARLIRRSGPTSERAGHRELHLVIGAVAMIYMFAVMPPAHQMASGEPASGELMSSTGLAIPVLSWAFTVYFVVFAVRLGARLAVPVGALAAIPAREVVVSPHLLGSSEVVMSIGMSYMLIPML